MEDSRSRYEDELQEILENYRNSFAGKKTVRCATGLGLDAHYDFSNVKREDINYSINGENYVVAKAKNIQSEEVGVCYLKYVTKKAIVIESQEEFNNRISSHLETVKEKLPETLKAMNFEAFVTTYCNDLRDLLIEKNKSYGNSALEPVRIFSKADSEEQIKVRLDDKLSRIANGNDSFNEDTIQDLQGYLILLQYKKSQE